MNSTDPLPDHAGELADAARAFHEAASQPGSHAAGPLSLARTEEALQLLSTSWYQLAADAPSRGETLSHEQEVRLRAAHQDVAAALARCARACRDARAEIARRPPALRSVA
jgi:hypothetical protein